MNKVKHVIIPSTMQFALVSRDSQAMHSGGYLSSELVVKFLVKEREWLYL